VYSVGEKVGQAAHQDIAFLLQIMQCKHRFLIFIYYPNIVVKILGQPVGLFYRSSSVNMANWCIVLHSNSKSPTAPIDSTAKAHQNKEVKKDGYIFLRHFIGSQKKNQFIYRLELLHQWTVQV
jgi:hypothetical protein